LLGAVVGGCCWGLLLGAVVGGCCWGRGSGSLFPAGGHALFQDAVVLDYFDSGGLGPAGGFVVDYPFLEPEVRDFEADDVFDDFGDIRGSTEDVDEVDVRMGGNGFVEGGVSLFAEGLFDLRIDGNDAVALRLHEAGDAQGSSAFAVGEANDSDGVDFVEDFGDGRCLVHSLFDARD